MALHTSQNIAIIDDWLLYNYYLPNKRIRKATSIYYEGHLILSLVL